MPKKSSPVFQKVYDLLDMSIFLAKMRKPIIKRLISLRKAKKMKKFSLLKHYNYGYIQEYQFSPSNTPSIHYCNRKNSLRSYRDICSVFFISRCLGMANREGEEKRRRKYPVLELERLASMEEFTDFGDDNDNDDDDDDDCSVNERAEKFIERFYEEIKLQRQESFLEEFNVMVDNS